MPPKPKEALKKATAPIVRPAISETSLVFIPEDALEGYQERIETDIDWTVTEAGTRYHKHMCCREEIPDIPLSLGLHNKLEKSIANGFLGEESSLTLKEQWEIMLAMAIFDNEKCATEQGKVCFRSVNCITDNLVKMIENAVIANDSKVLYYELRNSHVLRVNDSKITEIDEILTDFRRVASLNLCGNYISEIETRFLPQNLRILELQNNRVRNIGTCAEYLPEGLAHLGLAGNSLTNEGCDGFSRLPQSVMVVDLSCNDIYDLGPLLESLNKLPRLVSLSLTGNPCSVCAAYARQTLNTLRRLEYLDSRTVLPTDRSAETLEVHPDDLRAAYFNFSILRIMSAPVPPKPEKGVVTTFHVEFELPFLDPIRRRFLMYRENKDLVQILPSPEDDEMPPESRTQSINTFMETEESKEFDIYAHLVPKNSRIIHHYTTFESNKIPWNKIMNFQEPAVRIFCPDLVALRNTFGTIITLRLVYTLTVLPTKGKPDKKSSMLFKPTPAQQSVTLATIKCALRSPDWSQPAQHFHWDSTLGTEEAMHWGDGDLSILQYNVAAAKPVKGKPDQDAVNLKQLVPESLTCHFGFGIETLRL